MVTDIRKWLEQAKGKRSQIENNISITIAELKESKRSLIRHEEARVIVKEVGLKTQQQLSFHIGDITSLALEAVFDDPYELKADFVERRNQTECDLYFERDGEKMDPLDSSGGGAVDVAAFALRIASWSMSNPKTRSTIILDEPMRFLSQDNQEKASLMIKEISEKLNLQFIIVTHEETLTIHADKIFEVSIRKKISKVKILE